MEVAAEVPAAATPAVLEKATVAHPPLAEMRAEVVEETTEVAARMGATEGLEAGAVAAWAGAAAAWADAAAASHGEADRATKLREGRGASPSSSTAPSAHAPSAPRPLAAAARRTAAMGAERRRRGLMPPPPSRVPLGTARCQQSCRGWWHAAAQARRGGCDTSGALDCETKAAEYAAAASRCPAECRPPHGANEAVPRGASARGSGTCCYPSSGAPADAPRRPRGCGSPAAGSHASRLLRLPPRTELAPAAPRYLPLAAARRRRRADDRHLSPAAPRSS